MRFEVRFRCLRPRVQHAFYSDLLGMQERDGGVGYPGESQLRFEACEGEPYSHRPRDLYWKVAVTVPDLDSAVAELRGRGVQVSDPNHFLDVGYLAHLADPEGFQIELLQEDFHGRPRRANAPLGGASFRLVTLRCGDLGALDAAAAELGLRKVGIEPVPSYGFSLHFYGFTDAEPPDADLTAVVNRPWMYQLPTTLLEFQHRPGLQPLAPHPEGPGYAGLRLRGTGERPHPVLGPITFDPRA